MSVGRSVVDLACSTGTENGNGALAVDGSAMTTGTPSGPAVTIFHGDACDLLPSLDPGSVDLLITSPPYWGHRTYEQEHNWDIFKDWLGTGAQKTDVPDYEWYRERGGSLGLEPVPDWYIAHLVEMIERFRPALKSSGSLWINLGDTYFARWASIRQSGRQGLGDKSRQRRRTPMGGYRQEKQLLLIPARFAIAMQEKRWILRNDVIWYKPNVPPRPEKDRLRLSHEHFFHFVARPTNGRARYYYDLSETETGSNDVITHYVRPGESGHTEFDQGKNQRWLADKIEGPNIANVFKRTFYQMMLKFQIGLHPRSVGTSLAIPQAVWDSWQPHLGRPDLISRDDGTQALQHPDVGGGGTPAWIHVFDIEVSSATHPSPIAIKQTIMTDAASIARYAIEEVPNHAFLETGAAVAVIATIHRRLSTWWPELTL